MTAADLLDIWDRCATEPPERWALTLLARTCPELSPEAVADLPVGARDRRLLELRSQLFGSTIAAVQLCPSCGERLELNFDTTALLTTPEPDAGTAYAISCEGYEVTFRLPTSRDLQRATAGRDIAQRRAELLERCVITALHDDAPVEVARLPASVTDAVDQAMESADPLANIELDLRCVDCGTIWPAQLDIAAFLRSELGPWARRVMREVHRLASAYGWSERDILALSPQRRRLYLEMIYDG